MVQQVRMAIVLNQSARILGTRGEEIAADIVERCNKIGTVASTQLVDPPSLATTLAEAASSKPDVLLVGGGDGTIATAAAIVVQTGVVLGILPLVPSENYIRA